MRLDLATWPEVEAYLTARRGILLPVGSTEQHGPMGLIGTDTFCATAIAERAADQVGAYMAPPGGYTPAPFNTGFPGTVSVSEPVFKALITEIVSGLQAQGFTRVFILNAHGANLAPMRAAFAENADIRIKSWWDDPEVNALRDQHFGTWEGLHATPSEVSITQALHRSVPPGAAATPPRKLTDQDKAARAGDTHGPPEQHRREFPDGRVGAHSALATPESGHALLDVASTAVANDFRDFEDIP